MNKLVKTSFIASLLMSLAMPVMAAPSPTAMEHKAAMSKVDGACMASAVDKRDTAIMSAWDTMSSAIKTAFQTRKDALKAAWNNTDVTARKQGIKTAWEDFRKAVKTARMNWRGARHDAWKQFYQDRKACGAGAAKQDVGTEAVDSSL